MTSDFSACTTRDLLRMIYDGEDHGEDFGYHALWTVFGRWGKGIDLEPLIELLQSEKSVERERAAWYLDEADPPAHLMADAVIKLADDSVGYCRRKFVDYVTNSRLYNDTIAECLAACLLDRDLYVRANTIFWAVATSDEKFPDFSRAVQWGASTKPFKFSDPENTTFWRESERKRAQRGIHIASRLRAGDTVEHVRESIPEEDSYTFDQLAFLKQAIKRCLERRARKADAKKSRTQSGS